MHFCVNKLLLRSFRYYSSIYLNLPTNNATPCSGSVYASGVEKGAWREDLAQWTENQQFKPELTPNMKTVQTIKLQTVVSRLVVWQVERKEEEYRG